MRISPIVHSIVLNGFGRMYVLLLTALETLGSGRPDDDSHGIDQVHPPSTWNCKALLSAYTLLVGVRVLA